MIFNAGNLQDVRKYYLGSFVKFPDFGEMVCHIEDVGCMREVEGERVPCITGTCSNGDYFHLPIWPEQPYELSYVLPKKGFFVYKQDLYQLRRIPARQYCRGISLENTAIVKATPRGDWGGCDLSLELLQAYVDKPKIKFPFLSDLSKKTPILLSRRFAVFPYTGAVFLDTRIVGECTIDTIKIKKLVFPEVSALLQGSDIKVEAV